MAMNTFQNSYVSSPHIGHEQMHSGISTTSTVPQAITAHEAIEVAGRNVEKMIHGDSQFPSLAEKLRLGKETDLNSI